MKTFYRYLLTVSIAMFIAIDFSMAFEFPWGNKEGIQWGSNLQQAQALSRQTGKPILLHFYSDTCPPCRMMEANTFPNPSVVEAIQSSFIPVKLNTRHYPHEAKMFNIQAVPTDIILSPDGRMLQMAQGGQDASRYTQFLGTVVPPKAATPSGQDPFNANPSVQPPTPPNDPFPPMPKFPNPPGGDPPPVPQEPQIQPGGACPIEETPSFNYAAIPDEDKARIEFEGYCPVELGQRSMWVRGDYNIRMVFEDRLYLFAGERQRDEFRNNPGKYAPAYQGIDIVAWKERGEKVHGTRNYGAWAAGRVFLFSSEENLVKFERNARYYLTPNK